MTHNRKRHKCCKFTFSVQARPLGSLLAEIKEMTTMSLKGDKTRQIIREKAYQLFAQKGFKEVTMKDICASTGLSRGGLYRHYESTEQIFLEIVNAFSNRQKDEVFTKIEQRIPAISKEDNSITRQYETSKSTWIELINYGIGTKEFNPVNPESVFHVILFAY